ncbi:TIGR03086 family metal-binding protein [Actinokineospora soli]|uniref:TIGR03086 family metal-binding protein n=1 Tax=Actinokineospora soli TaxID=1048753 RepID=A0ABW2TKH2_9PSEU
MFQWTHAATGRPRRGPRRVRPTGPRGRGLGRSHPCTEWTVRDLVNHLTSEHFWAPYLLRGATLPEVGDRFDGDVLGPDPVDAWTRASTASRAAFHERPALTGQVHTSGGPINADEYAWQMIFDLTIHSWDLARGAGLDDRLDPDLVMTVTDELSQYFPVWYGAILDHPVAVPPTAGDQDRLIAATGRHPDWSSSRTH